MTSRRGELARNGAQLAGMWALSVAQPLFDLIDSGEIFVTVGWRGGDIVVFAVLAMFLFPALMLAFEALAARIRASAGPALHVVFMGGLAGVFTAYAIKQNTDWGSGELSLALSLTAGVLAATAFRRLPVVRSFTTAVGGASVLFLVLFLFGSPVRHLVLPADGADHAGPRPSAPVVLIVFDEFPTLSMLDRRGELDRRSFPAFASLADDGIWFRNATTVADFTTTAVPAILTGRRPGGVKPASISAHPDNLLAFLGRRGGFDGHEDKLTRLCPGDVCARNRPRRLPRRFTRALPSLAKLSLAPWLPEGIYRHLPVVKSFGKEISESSLERFGTAPDAAIHYLHLQLPHAPWLATPSGKSYRTDMVELKDFVPEHPVSLKAGFGPPAAYVWVADERRVTAMRQRHLAQARYTDRTLGEVLARLRRSGIYDRAMVVVTADHGTAFEPGVDSRQLEDANSPAVMMVPLFVKPPGSRMGSTSERFVQTIDIAPTIAGALDVELPWETDGRSVLADSAPDRERLTTRAVVDDADLEFDAASLERRLRAAAAEQAGLFAGADPDRIFRTGPHRAVLGKRPAELARGGPSGLRYALRGSPPLDFDVQPDEHLVPALVAGRLDGDRTDGRELLVAVNGRLVAGARSREPGGRFEALLPEGAFRMGRNELTIYAAEAGSGGPRLSEIPPAAP